MGNVNLFKQHHAHDYIRNANFQSSHFFLNNTVQVMLKIINLPLLNHPLIVIEFRVLSFLINI